jgi:hypothetical protein
MKFINDSIHSHGNGESCTLLNRHLHEFPGFEAAIILTAFLCRVNIIFLPNELPSNYSIFSYGMKVDKINSFGSFSVTSVKRIHNSIT